MSRSLEHALDLAGAGEDPTRWDQIYALARSLDDEELARLDAALAGWSDAARPAPPTWRAHPSALRIARSLWALGLDTDGAEWLAGTPYLQVTHLTVGGGIGAQGVRALAASPNLARARSLTFIGSGMGADGASALAASPHLSSLTALRLTGADLGTEGVRALTASSQLTGLRELGLEYGVGPGGAAILAASPILAGCQILELGNSEIGDDGARSLAASPHLTRLVELDLRGADVGDDGVRALASSMTLGAVERLNLAFAEGLGIEALAALVSQQTCWRLRQLGLAYTYPDPEVLAALSGPRATTLTDLDLTGNMLEADAIEGLLAAENLAALTRLDLTDNSVGAAGVVAIAEAGLSSLSALNLQGNSLGDSGAKALADTTLLGGLRELNLRANNIGDAGMAALAAAGLGHLEVLNLGFNPIGIEGFQALCQSDGPGPSTLHVDNIVAAARPLLQAWQSAEQHRRIDWGREED